MALRAPGNGSSPGLFVSGPARSGTSMTAGLFDRHGVFFGRCLPSSRMNPRGFFEHRWLKGRLHGRGIPDPWPGSWFEKIREEGWRPPTPWGLKLMPGWWPKVVRPLEPTVVILCRRPVEAIMDSARRAGWRDRTEEFVRARIAEMDRAGEEARALGIQVFEIDTPALVKGDLQGIPDALGALGLGFDPDISSGWIQPLLFHGGPS